MPDHTLTPADVAALEIENERARELERWAKTEHDQGKPQAVLGMSDALMEQAIIRRIYKEAEGG